MEKEPQRQESKGLWALRKRNYKGLHFWAKGYHVSTVGRDEEAIRKYIKDQEQEDRRLDQLEMFG